MVFGPVQICRREVRKAGEDAPWAQRGGLKECRIQLLGAFIPAWFFLVVLPRVLDWTANQS